MLQTKIAGLIFQYILILYEDFTYQRGIDFQRETNRAFKTCVILSACIRQTTFVDLRMEHRRAHRNTGCTTRTKIHLTGCHLVVVKTPLNVLPDCVFSIYW